MPVGGFILMSPMNMTRLSTNIETYTDPITTIGTADWTQSIQFNVQIDCYGPLSGDWAAIITTLLRSEYATDIMVNCKPLYATDPQQLALVDGEQQYELRWTFDAAIQYNPSISTPMQFASTLGPVTIYSEQ